MKRRFFSILIVAVSFLVPLALALIGFCTPACFDETYYGELRHMYRRLETAEGKKIVLIGNSALAFGVRSDLMEAEFPGYTVVNFGLYGAIGTKTMLDLSRSHIGEGDIVIVAPERNGQAQSLYFSAENVWMAMDGAFGMLGKLKREHFGAMAGNFFGFLSQKYAYLVRGGKPNVSGVYRQAAFDDEAGNEVGYMTYERTGNLMAGGFDGNDPVDFSAELPKDFFDYLNEYNRLVTGRGATLYYGFTPVDRAGLKEGTDAAQFGVYADILREALDFRILGDPQRYVMDREWFYDSNFHLNSAGMSVYTDRLAEDLKAELGINTPNRIELPEKPPLLAPGPAEGENGDGECFVYEEAEEGVRIVGLSEAGQGRTSYVIPASYQGKRVVSFAASVFAGNTTVREITVQANIRLLYDGSFTGCTGLERLNIEQEDPNALAVGYGLLDGAERCRVYIGSAVYDLFATHYRWGVYRDRLVAAALFP